MWKRIPTHPFYCCFYKTHFALHSEKPSKFKLSVRSGLSWVKQMEGNSEPGEMEVIWVFSGQINHPVCEQKPPSEEPVQRLGRVYNPPAEPTSFLSGAAAMRGISPTTTRPGSGLCIDPNGPAMFIQPQLYSLFPTTSFNPTEKLINVSFEGAELRIPANVEHQTIYWFSQRRHYVEHWVTKRPLQSCTLNPEPRNLQSTFYSLL